jgi:diadenosine tetraphosphatase ApaH/serine/threonine PP2A family protein phosphatase
MLPLPLSLRDENLCFVHGSPHNQHEYLMPEVNAFTALERVMATGADVLFCGHAASDAKSAFAD